MNDNLIWVVLIICGYILGSVPVSLLVGLAHGIDLRKHGTHQVGAGNLWRMTSRKFGLAVGIFDFLKGLAMVWIAKSQGLDTGEQLIVGLAVIIGHNWPVFLRFHGGRGIATLLGIAIILPSVNDTSPWPTIIAVAFVVVMTIIFRSSALPVLISAASLPLTTWIFEGYSPAAMAYLAIFLIVVIKRLTAQSAPDRLMISRGELIMNRLLFDRDIRDKTAWMHRKPVSDLEKLDE
jgi:glycerol-3-phosphate acyltransferase PlsY